MRSTMPSNDVSTSERLSEMRHFWTSTVKPDDLSESLPEILVSMACRDIPRLIDRLRVAEAVCRAMARWGDAADIDPAGDRDAEDEAFEDALEAVELWRAFLVKFDAT
jgi:hypothetical protein